MTDWFARATIAAARMFVSGTAFLIVSLVLAIVGGFYAKLLWRAARYGWDLIL